ncbi:MAG: tRNA (N6-threonylcarbamoyladenosine(37)-N6)-methyltransferase TrmO, partial [bacterium]|nr:tRNA (N6-threonylcarbamoyladenosine(37)-N6)-methyltransferase TrmO [bacterium]
KPYKKGPDKVGVFATRSPVRPNPIALSLIYIINIDYDKGLIYIPYIDADIGTPVLDLKPYHLSTDNPASVSVPEWCSHWPKSIEQSGEFNWEAEFNF